ncbi:hypothetical protein DICPUDRAFT_18841, partial [Dictyostelium purpureum]
MSSKRANYPMDQGGWNLWNIKNRQKAQRLWMINQIINKIETNKIESEYQHSWKHQISTKTITSDYLFKNYNDWIQIKVKKGLLDGLKSIKNKDGKPLSLAEWYSEINNLNSFTPKTEFQQCLQLTGYSYINLFNNILNIKDPKSRNTLFKFQARCLPINFIHNKPCRLCNENLNNDPYGHLFFKCKKTLKFINFNKLKSFIFITSGRGLNWSLDITRSRRNISIKNITYKIPEGRKSDGEINMDYNNTRFHKSHFQWNYKAIDFDLTRCFAYRNAIALVFHHVWIWLCKELYDDQENTIKELDYKNLTSKWTKLATLEYLKGLKNIKERHAKQPQTISNINEEYRKFKRKIARAYFISIKSLPNINSLEYFL